jgi:hypothetical protein
MLTKDEMINYFKQMNIELNKLHITGEICLTGGASMCLVHKTRLSTDDIDASLNPSAIIKEIAIKIAQKNKYLTNYWINDAVSAFMISDPPKELVIEL